MPPRAIMANGPTHPTAHNAKRLIKNSCTEHMIVQPQVQFARVDPTRDLFASVSRSDSQACSAQHGEYSIPAPLADCVFCESTIWPRQKWGRLCIVNILRFMISSKTPARLQNGYNGHGKISSRLNPLVNILRLHDGLGTDCLHLP